MLASGQEKPQAQFLDPSEPLPLCITRPLSGTQSLQVSPQTHNAQASSLSLHTDLKAILTPSGLWVTSALPFSVNLKLWFSNLNDVH